MFPILFDYTVRILPGIVVTVLFLMLMPKSALPFRMIAYILFFLLIRDTMTPTKIWSFGREGLFWMRWVNEPIVLVMVGFVGLGVVILMNLIDKDLKDLIIWTKGSKTIGLAVGFGGAVLIVLPFFAIYSFTPIEVRGGTVSTGLLLPILILTLLGNLYEEVLFRVAE